MDDIGNVGRRAARGEIRGRAQIDHLTGVGDRVGVQIHALEHLLRLRIEFKARQHLFVAHTAARILIHDLDQLGDRVPAVADDMARRAPRCRDQFAVDHQEAMVVTLQESLDDHRSRMLARYRKSLRHFFVRREPNRDAAAVVAVVGLGHDGKSDALRGANGLLFVVHQFLFRYRQSERGQDLVGFFLVAGEFDRDVRGAAGDRRLNPLLVLAVAQLHQRLIIEAQPGNAVIFGRAHQCGRRGSERAPLREADEFVARLLPSSNHRGPSRPAGSPAGRSEHSNRRPRSPAAMPSSRCAYS